jgi:hypothetical protein
MSDERNPNYPPSDRWDTCKHDWDRPMDPVSEGEVRCTKCGCPGDRGRDGTVYWPAT